jgi:hypothetical protein
VPNIILTALGEGRMSRSRDNEAPASACERAVLTCSSLAEAEDLLDWLENHGCTDIEVSLDAGQVVVRCACPVGLRLVRDEAGALELQPAQ